MFVEPSTTIARPNSESATPRTPIDKPNIANAMLLFDDMLNTGGSRYLRLKPALDQISLN